MTSKKEKKCVWEREALKGKYNARGINRKREGGWEGRGQVKSGSSIFLYIYWYNCNFFSFYG